VAGGARITSSDVDASRDYLDYLGHGTAVAGAIREKAPDAQLYAVKVFDRVLTTNIEAIIRAIEWCLENRIDVINLSLGTLNPEHREVMEMAVARATNKSLVLVAAREMSGKLSFPGCLPSVIATAEDWHLPRNSFRVDTLEDGPVFVASAYPREIPGVPKERNLNGISFAVANMSGFVARAREMAPRANVAQLKRLLVEEATCE
jgi:subtilisin family serine protease